MFTCFVLLQSLSSMISQTEIFSTGFWTPATQVFLEEWPSVKMFHCENENSTTGWAHHYFSQYIRPPGELLYQPGLFGLWQLYPKSLSAPAQFSHWCYSILLCSIVDEVDIMQSDLSYWSAIIHVQIIDHLHRGGIWPCRQCRLQCKIFASGVNFSIFTHFFVLLSLKLLKLGEIDGVKVLAWNSGGVKFLTNSMSARTWT